MLDDRDILLHHPYDSFDPVVAFVDAAADDPDVLAIKQTLYRTSGDSPIVPALHASRRPGKQVTVIVELMARFDEAAQHPVGARARRDGRARHLRHPRLQSAREDLPGRAAHRDGLRRYVHLGTGNYNDKTARLYTDLGLLTSAPVSATDASAFFSALTGYSDPPRLKRLAMAPTVAARARAEADRARDAAVRERDSRRRSAPR